jgi:hypothetical protein
MQTNLDTWLDDDDLPPQRITKPENLIIIPTPDETTRESAAVAMERDADERETVAQVAPDSGTRLRKMQRTCPKPKP